MPRQIAHEDLAPESIASTWHEFVHNHDRTRRISPDDQKAWIEQEGFEIVRTEGSHVVSWQFLPRPVLRWLDRKFRSRSYPCALNLAVFAKRA